MNFSELRSSASEIELSANNPTPELSPPHADPQKTAPGRLELVQRFVNTALPDRADRIAAPEALASWLIKFKMLAPGVAASKTETNTAQSLRRLLRKAIARNLDAIEQQQLNEVANHLKVSVFFDSAGLPGLKADRDSVQGALAQLLEAASQAQLRGEWRRLRMCNNPDCGRTFYDNTKNGSGIWCSMLTCGNKHNARKYRTRKTQA